MVYMETIPIIPSVSPNTVRDNANKSKCVVRIRNAKAILIVKPQPVRQYVPGREGESELMKRCIHLLNIPHTVTINAT
jgi:hypothetical protein